MKCACVCLVRYVVYFLAKCCWKIKEDEEVRRCRKVFMKVFNGSIGIKGLCLCCKSRRKERSKETK